MQFSVILALGLAGAASADSWLKSLSEYTNEIPSCAAAAFKTGMKNQGCDVVNVAAKDFDCLCDHYGKIEGRVYLDVVPSCSAGMLRSIHFVSFERKFVRFEH